MDVWMVWRSVKGLDVPFAARLSVVGNGVAFLQQPTEGCLGNRNADKITADNSKSTATAVIGKVLAPKAPCMLSRRIQPGHQARRSLSLAKIIRLARPLSDSLPFKPPS